MMTAPATTGDHNQAYVMFSRMIPHHEDAIEMAQLTQTRSDNPDVKALAIQIQTAQQPEIEQMKGWLANWNEPTIPAGVGPGGMEQGGNTPGGMMSRGDMTHPRVGARGAEAQRGASTLLRASAEPEEQNGSKIANTKADDDARPGASPRRDKPSRPQLLPSESLSTDLIP